jgi:hypothetical protein
MINTTRIARSKIFKLFISLIQNNRGFFYKYEFSETTVQDRIDIQEPLLQAAYDEVKNEIDTRILNDQTINTVIDNYIIAEDQYLRKDIYFLEKINAFIIFLHI